MKFGKLTDKFEVVPCPPSEFMSFRILDNQKDIKKSNVGCLIVSTVFLGVNIGNGWFETMIYNKEGEFADLDGYTFQERHETYLEAMNRHEEICRMARVQIEGGRKRLDGPS